MSDVSISKESAQPEPQPQAGQPATTPVDKIRGALLRYRALAWITGVWLILLVVEMVAKYGFDIDGYGWVGIVHGWIYFAYLIFTVDLAIKVRWPVAKTVITAIAGTIPFLSFYFEHIRTKDVKEQFGI